MAKKPRNFRSEYDNYQGKPEQIKKRASRNKARAMLEKEGLNLKGKDVDHIDTNALNDDRSNLRVRTKSANRSFPRNSKAGKKKK